MTKAKIMRVAKLLQSFVLFSGLEQASGELVPFRMDLETVILYEEKVWFSFEVIFIMLFVVMLAGFFFMYKANRKLQQELQRVQHQQQQMVGRQGELTMEIAMLQIHVNALHVASMRLGGYVDLNVPITERDWDNLRYIERGNRIEDDRVCRRGLRHLRVSTRALRRRRHSTPPAADRHLHADASRSRDGDGTPPEEMTQEEYNRRMESEDPEDWPAEPAEERRRRYMQSTMSECSDPDEWIQMHHGEPGSGLYLQGDEEEHPTEDESPVPSERDTVMSEFMKQEYLEWPSHDFSASHDRAQLSALQWINDFSQRRARAIADGNERLADWCRSQIGLHQPYSRSGTTTLEVQR